jgi:transcription-repair coupling factor (superfamily II helicase)
LELLKDHKHASVSGAGNHSSKVFILSDVLRGISKFKTILWMVNDHTDQESVLRALKGWTDIDVYGFGILPLDSGQIREIEKENNLRTIEFLARIKEKKPKIIVTPYLNFMNKVPDIEELKQGIVGMKSNQSINVMAFFEMLIERGYEVSEDQNLKKGEYSRTGEVLSIFPINSDHPIKIEIGFDEVNKIYAYDQATGEKVKDLKQLEIYPLKFSSAPKSIADYFNEDTLIIEDEIDIIDDFYDTWNALVDQLYKKSCSLSFVTFNEDDQNHQHLHYLSILKYRGVYDLTSDLRQKYTDGWRVMIFTKNNQELANIFKEHNIPFNSKIENAVTGGANISLVEIPKEDIFPQAFQNPELKLAVLSDKEISSLREEKKKYFNQKVYLDFLTSLKFNDYVVHSDHGIARFLGLEKRTVDEITREYLKLGYAENDKLFVPIDQADKVNKFIGADEATPHLTRLGSAEWNTITRKVQKETEVIAKELLILYAKRKSARGHAFKLDDDVQSRFEETFPYEETPGQVRAILEVKADMEKAVPMDRLVCGDVGFGKTEVAMRAAFKAVRNGKQAVFISPITILADQHYRAFKRRLEEFDVRIEMLSRFRTASEQKKIVKQLERGEIDIIIGTHRLLQPDVKFKNLGLVIIDEEQRFGVKQKEALKKFKTEVDVLTLTATPIPRTLNIALNKLRDITTITTPPPGRLPIITEVRRYSQGLIREAILREINRGGQVYFLHNRVQTIDGVADKLRSLVPEAKFGVTHGKLGSGDLEERILAFKDHKFDVLVSSTIIENGIDLANANTLIVNNAERFGLAQLYQLRGRVGRGRTQAYAYFLYQGQRLKLSAKKRLKAIVEASELGSGFQIAMKDLEIRGAGDILGAKQHGVINVVGVSHFMRMLNKAVDDLKTGKATQAEEAEEVSIELPLTSYIPDSYIVSSKDKINAYQKLSSVDKLEYLNEIREELIEEYGTMPKEVLNLFRIIELKILARKSGLVSIKAESVYLNKGKEVVLHMSNRVKPENIMNLLEHHSKWVISGNRLRIKIEDLGLHWFDELKECVKHLAQSLKVEQKSPARVS